MIKLINILQEILNELGDTDKFYHYRLVKSRIADVLKDDDGLYKNGCYFEYEFRPDNEIRYLVSVEFSIGDPEEKGEKHQIAGVDFTTSNSFKSTHKFDISKVMRTIVEIVKEVKSKVDFDYIVYTPFANDDDYNPDQKKKLQKDKLYKYYIEKEFHGSKFMGNPGDMIYVKLI